MKSEVRVRAGRKARRKGKSGEYQVRDILQKTFYPNGEGVVERTPMSGAWHALPVLSGDLVFIKDEKPDYAHPFFWEVKFYDKKKLSPFQMMSGKAPVLERWLVDAKKKRSTPLHIPLIIWRVTSQPWFVFLSMESFCRIDLMKRLDPNTVTVLTILNRWVIMPLDDFLGWAKTIRWEVQVEPQT